MLLLTFLSFKGFVLKLLQSHTVREALKECSVCLRGKSFSSCSCWVIVWKVFFHSLHLNLKSLIATSWFPPALFLYTSCSRWCSCRISSPRGLEFVLLKSPGEKSCQSLFEDQLHPREKVQSAVSTVCPACASLWFKPSCCKARPFHPVSTEVLTNDSRWLPAFFEGKSECALTGCMTCRRGIASYVMFGDAAFHLCLNKPLVFSHFATHCIPF